MSISYSFIYPLPLSGDRGVFAKASLGTSLASGPRAGVAKSSYPSRATVSHAATVLGDEVQGVLQQQQGSVSDGPNNKNFQTFFSWPLGFTPLPQKQTSYVPGHPMGFEDNNPEHNNVFSC